MKNGVKSYFSFSKRELNGILIVCMLITATAFFPFIYIKLSPPKTYNFVSFQREIKAFKNSAQANRSYSYKQLKDEIEDRELKAEYFEFDPNGLSPSEWHRLGLSNRQIKVIKNFESKGGRFYKKEDLQKIYSITPSDYARLEPYIRIQAAYSGKEFKQYNATEERYQKKEQGVKHIVIVELNAADSTTLEGIRGIGPAFASRILRYKNRLGGFYSKEQLLEVYGMDTAKYQQIKDLVTVKASAIQKINVNIATFDEMKRHPYLSYKQMNAIIQYRKQHGAYASVGDLKKITILNAEILRKIEPYLSF